MSIDISNGIPIHCNPLGAHSATGTSRVASKFQQGFSPLLTGGPTPGETGKALEQLAENPTLSRVLVANGGYGLQAFVQSLGLMDVDGSLHEACSKLLTMSQTRIPAAPAGSTNRTLTLDHPSQSLSQSRRKSDDENSHSQRPLDSLPRRLVREQTIEENDLASSLAKPIFPSASNILSQDTEQDLSNLSARFESGDLGAGAIGYDQVGGTSYGLYQIASNTGTMDRFLNYLDDKAPDLSKRLHNAGPANTGGKEGAMPDVWKTIAKETPKRFADLQKGFIQETHFKPAARKVQEMTGIDVTGMSQTLQEVLWSTAVQHGASGGADIFAEAVEKSGKPSSQGFESRIIEHVYAERSGRFGSSSQRVQDAVRNRFQTEKQLALLMLQSEQA